ncbi:uncharacterized protein [Amphiura filiformis]|uniref:uncharacterized protein n=1 Tax=Amphiura filiformis TaxID=82378 RepID=UPI003B213988
MAESNPVDNEEDIDSLINCGICRSEMEQPKALTCLHTFCFKCLKNVKHPTDQITCPLCQEDTLLPKGGVDELQNNFFINQLKERKAIRGTGEFKMLCKCCKKDKVNVARCVDCCGFICQDCADLHKTIDPLSNHKVYTIDELRSGEVDISKVWKEQRCHNHKNQILMFFCKTCGIPICMACGLYKHSRPEHDFIEMEPAAEDHKKEMKGLLASCRDVAKRVDTAIKQDDKLQKEIGKDGEGMLSNGFGVAIASNGDIAVADFHAAKVKVYRSDGQYKLSLDTTQGLQQGTTSHPWGVAVSPNQFYVTDLTGVVKIYSLEGQYLKQFPVKSPDGTSSDTDGSRLHGLAIDNDGHLLVGNYTKRYISKCKQDGTHISTIKVDIRPWFIVVTPIGRIVVSPGTSNAGVYVLDQTGKHIHTIKAPKDAKSWYPTGVCCSDDGVIYIASWNSRDQGGIYRFTEDGEYLGCVTTDVTKAYGLAYTCDDGDDKLVVAQSSGHPAKKGEFSFIKAPLVKQISLKKGLPWLQRIIEASA